MGLLTGCDLMGIYTGTTFNTIQPMKVMINLWISKGSLYPYVHTQEMLSYVHLDTSIPRALFTLEQLETTKCHQLQNKSLSMHAMVIQEQ